MVVMQERLEQAVEAAAREAAEVGRLSAELETAAQRAAQLQRRIQCMCGQVGRERKGLWGLGVSVNEMVLRLEAKTYTTPGMYVADLRLRFKILVSSSGNIRHARCLKVQDPNRAYVWMLAEGAFHGLRPLGPAGGGSGGTVP